ncbi:MAG: hypothetical protein ABS99_08110 [Acetobacteraceae bacterium SCN 69-10]|nr:hypothetical protein [Rhodospirillales bacterium]ODU55094.1 MAG: hypothetical protein ABS99_08110 [Acetobacteraceae bacterium SCN 69-10]OJY74337.1 MAG: hypothetical protein BGP12_20245 [Rhodospirillales bacterium 70-18]
MSQSATDTKVGTIATNIKAFVKGKFGANIDDVGWMSINGLNGQPGLYINFASAKMVVKIFWSGQFSKMNATMPTVPIVLVDPGAPDKDGTLWMGVLFHEYGHAAMDKLGKNSEPAAYTVELLSLWDHVQKNPGDAEIVKTFVKARRAAKQYSGFLAGYEVEAKGAYASLAGEAFV